MQPQRGKITITQLRPIDGAPTTYTFPDAYFEIDGNGILIVSNAGGALAAYTNWHRVQTAPFSEPPA